MQIPKISNFRLTNSFFIPYPQKSHILNLIVGKKNVKNILIWKKYRNSGQNSDKKEVLLRTERRFFRSSIVHYLQWSHP